MSEAGPGTAPGPDTEGARAGRPVLTRRGWGVAVGALALALAGRLFGAVELYVLAAGAAALVVGALLVVAGRPPRLEATRRLSAVRAHAGEPTRVELRVVNERRSPSRPVWLHDLVTGGRRASLLLPSLPAGGGEQAFYHLPPLDRGLHRIGPLEAHLADPFGLLTRVVPLVPPSELLVYPRIDRLRALAVTTGDDPRAGARTVAPSPSADDFSALRPYQVGDDLRRVHWPSTARRDELMVRQHEAARQGRATVVLDARDAAHLPSTFEPAVSAAASVLAACRREGLVVRLVTTAGADSGFASGSAHFDAALAHLAVVSPGGGDLRDLVARLLAGDGAVVVVTADEQAAGEIRSVVGAHGRAPWTVVVFEDYRSSPAAARWAPGLVQVSAPGMFVPTWDRAMTGAARAVR